ncbi:MAG: NADH-quinone oxidoreductase subunit L [Gammaproteobacteria bacterium]|nr:NADH-quinone oxidoreductase subunit L [Gammaproteobacteria bacterium]
MIAGTSAWPWAIPGAYLVAALHAAARPSDRWRALAAATRVALALAGIGAIVALAGVRKAPASTIPDAEALVALLVAYLGWIIGDYAHRYLDGEPGQTRFVVAYLATLASVSAVVVTGDLAVLILAWSASSLSLHQLLTFYPDRPAAIIVAHKKFLASRLAEVCLAGAATLLYRQWRTLDLGALATLAGATPALPTPAAIAAALIAIAVLLKCAQLPLHGWLIQVMEAPTPVSALLHAGVVNLGGYVLIRLAPLISAAPTARALLVGIGGLTAVLAGLVMLTRITVKVRLAWSTCSQMGFMVMECGLGLYDLALLHLIAHAAYKAYSFLGAGGAVQDSLARRMSADAAPAATAPALAGAILAWPIAWGVVAGSVRLWHAAVGLPPIPGIATALLASGLATLLWSRASATLRPFGIRLLALAGATQLYLLLHAVLSARIGITATAVPAPLADAVVAGFLALYLAQAALVTRGRQALGRSALAERVYSWAYAGFYLDERFTRWTFRLWPVRGDAPATARERLLSNGSER